MLKKLPIALAQRQPDNMSEILLNRNQQIVYSLYQTKHISKEVYNNFVKSG